MARIFRIVSSLAAVLTAYCLYAALAVPLVEPQAMGPRARQTEVDRSIARASVESQREDLQSWFSEGDWELTSPKVLETPQGRLLLRDYQNLPDGRHVRIEPCTLVYLPRGPNLTETDRRRRAIVLRAPQGAVLEFDEKFDPPRGKIGKPIGGELIGPVTIHSQQRSSAPEDDLRIVTRDVTITTDSITTPHPIDFRFGPNQGRGRRLRIDLGNQLPRVGPAVESNFGSITSFELAEEVHMRIYVGSSDLFPGGRRTVPEPDGRSGASQAVLSGAQQAPVEIKCRGPFRFDAREYVATFSDQVDVLRANPDGPSDQITCELLSLHFEVAPASEPVQAGSDGARIPKLHPSRVSARGNPVVVTSPSNGLEARGQQLEYDVKTGFGGLIGPEEVMLRQDRDGEQREIHARELHFEPNASGPLGVLLAKGPGWLEGNLPGQQSDRVAAQWTESLHFRPHEQNQVLSVKGKAHVEMAASGSLDAEEIHFWLNELKADQTGDDTPAGGSVRLGNSLVPERLLARENVRIDAAQLTGATDVLQVWFVPAAPVAPPGASASGSGPELPGAVAPQPAEKVAAPAAEPAVNPQQRFNVSGNLLQAQVVLRGEQPHISEVVIDGNVRCAESGLAQADEEPLVLLGDRLHVRAAGQAQHGNPSGAKTASVTGQPARVYGRGLTLVGGTAESPGTIHLDEQRNKVWIQGEGLLMLPVSSDLDGNPLDSPQTLQVTWEGRMEFDGLTARFDDRVIARLEKQLLRTQTLRVMLARQLQFQADPFRERPELDQVSCRGGVFLEKLTYDGRGLVRVDRLQAADLDLERRTGDVTAHGPGWVTSVGIDDGRLSEKMPLRRRGNPPPASGPALQAEVRPPGLAYLGIHFDRILTGNQRSQQTVFHEQVRTVYGPVKHWEARLDPDHPEWLGENGFVLTCDQLAVTEMGKGADGQPHYELSATGNSVVEGASFTARAGRLTYAMAKDLLVLEGDRSDARLYRRTRLGAPDDELAARKILYWPSTQRSQVEDVHSLDLNNLTGVNASP